MDDFIINFENVSFNYENEEPGNLPAIRDVNIGFKRGEFTAVLGRNGSGKSTLAKLCNAILVPTEGKVRVNGMDTADESLTYDIRRAVGMVFQNPDNQIVATIVEDDVAFGPENLGIPPEEIRERVDSALKSVNMYELRDKEPHKLSGGQKQRVAIAGIIAMRTQCIVFDEPTAMLDPGGRAEVIATAKQLNKEFGITIILITHFMDEAVQADRVIVMNDGTVISDATPVEVFADREKIKNAGLDVPQAAQLADLLSDKGVELPKDILTSHECADELYKIISRNNQ